MVEKGLTHLLTFTHPAVVAPPIIGILTFVVMELCSQEMVTMIVVGVHHIINTLRYAVVKLYLNDH